MVPLVLSMLLIAECALCGIAARPESSDSAYVYATDTVVTLSSDGSRPDIVVLDYGESHEGHPTFEVISASGNTSRLELSFAESKFAFEEYQVSNLDMQPTAVWL